MLVKNFSSRHSLHKRLYFYSLLFFVLLLPFQPKWLPITLAPMVFGLFWLISGNWKNKLQTLSANRIAGLLFLYYLWIIIGSLYSARPDDAAKEVFSKIPFLIWPLLLGSISLIDNHMRKRLLYFYVMACLMSIFYCLINASYDYYESGNIREFFFVNLVEYKLVPPHYLGMYISFAYTIVLYRWLRKQYLLNRQADMVMLWVFALAIVLISVRMQYLVFVIVNFIIIFNYTRISRGLTTALLYSLGVLILFSSVIWVFPGSRNRIKDAYHETLSFEKEINDKQTNHRKFLWSAAWEIVDENFWLGVGTGAADYSLNNNLAEVDNAFWDGENVYFLRDRFYNIHNAFLQHWAANGFIGLLIFIALFLLPLLRKSTATGRFFLLICAMSFFTESMLERQAGILFFSFFYTLFFVSVPIVKDKSSSEEVNAVR